MHTKHNANVCCCLCICCFTCNLFNDAFSVTHNQTKQSRMKWHVNDELEGCGRKRSWPNWRYYPGICLEVLNKTTITLSKDCLCPGRDLNPGSPEYGVLATRPRLMMLDIFSDATVVLRNFVYIPQIRVDWDAYWQTAVFITGGGSHVNAIIVVIIIVVKE
jgi:hypothetical protein